jgi:hypothetical protein
MVGMGKALVAAALAVALSPAAWAQGQAELQIAARTDGGGASPACQMPVRMTNTGTARIGTFSAEVEAVDVRSGATLRLPLTNFGFIGVQPGETKEWTTLVATGAPCEQVRLRVIRAVCVRRCGEARWSQQGLAGLEVPSR